MSLVNGHIDNLKPYLSASHAVWKVDPDDRSRLLKLDWNEATIPPAPEVKAALSELANEPELFNLYPPTQNEELIDALATYAEVPSCNIEYFGSSDSLHEYIARVYLQKGDRAVILWPSYDNFRLTAESMGAEVAYSELDKDTFEFDAGRFEHDLEIAPCKLAYICNPNNPSGTLLSPDYLAELTKRHPNTLFIVDEAYIEFAHGTSKDLAVHSDNVIVTRTMSKAFAMAGFRFGYIIASESNIEALDKVRNSKNIPLFTQRAALAALSNIDYMQRYVAEVKQARSLLIEAVNEGKLRKSFHAFPSEGNFVLIRCASPQVKQRVLEGLEDAGIFVRNLSQSESVRNYIRITAGTCAQMERVIATLNALL